MTCVSLHCEERKHTTYCRFIQTGGCICLTFFLGICLSSCMMTGFGGITWNGTTEKRWGGAIAVNPINPVMTDAELEESDTFYLIEIEDDQLMVEESGYNVNIEIVRAMHFPEYKVLQGLMPYITGGVRKYERDTTINAGVGIFKWLISIIFVRLDYRHFFHDKYDGNRIYLGFGVGVPVIGDPG